MDKKLLYYPFPKTKSVFNNVPDKFKTKVFGISYPGGRGGISGNNFSIGGLVMNFIFYLIVIICNN